MCVCLSWYHSLELPSVIITPPTVTYIKGNATQISCTGVGVPLPSVTFGGITCVYLASPGEASESELVVFRTLKNITSFFYY